MARRRPIGKSNSRVAKPSTRQSPRQTSALKHRVESLERRLLLSTFYGSNSPLAPANSAYVGDVFDFQDVNGNFERIKLTGNITAEVVGAEVDPLTNRVQLIDLPGMMVSKTGATPVRGGIITPKGADVIGGLSINDPLTALGSVGNAVIHALATDPLNGQTYAVVEVPQTTTGGGGGGGGNATLPNLLEIVGFNGTRGTVIAEVQSQAIAAAGNNFDNPPASTSAPQVTGATAAAFSPLDGRLYFVATGGTSSIPQLMSVNVHAGNNTAIANSLVGYNGTFNSFPPQQGNAAVVYDVSALVFDQTGPNAVRMIAVANPPSGANAAPNAPAPVTSFVQVALDQNNRPTNTNFGGGGNTSQVLFTSNVAGNAITGMALRNDNPNAFDNVYYGLVGAANSDVATGAAGGGGGGNTGATGGALPAGSVIQIHLPVEQITATNLGNNQFNVTESVDMVGGTFTLTLSGSGLVTPQATLTTNPIGIHATPAQVQAALELLANVGPGNVTVTAGLAPLSYSIGFNLDNVFLSGANPLTVTTDTGYITGFGSLYDTAIPNFLTAPAVDRLEANPGDLTFEPNVIDPFTGELGALVATDAVTNVEYFVSTFNRAPHDSIYSIYISQSDASGAISVSAVQAPTTNQNLGTRTPTPFAGSIGTIRYSATRTIAAPGATGTALLGARKLLIAPNMPAADNTPIQVATLDQTFQELPLLIGDSLGPGLTVAPNQTVGKFLFGGTVMGTVNIPGSIDEFYAGWLITGNPLNTATQPPSTTDPNGDPGGAGATAAAGNFSVGGDLRNLIVKGPIGVDGGFVGNNATPGFAAPTYSTGFDLVVGGSIGMLKAGGSIVGTVHALHNAPANLLLGSSQEEAANPAWSFNTNQLGGDPFFNDGTFANPQYLGAIPTAINGPNSAVQVVGELEAVLPPPAGAPNNFADYYGVPLLAGQTVTAQISNAGLSSSTTVNGVTSTVISPISDEVFLGIFDPDGRLIATDYSDLNTLTANGQPIRFTATKPGVYRLAVATSGNITFQATGTAAFAAGTFGYTLNVMNVGDLAIGAIVSGSTIFDNTQPDSALIPDASFGSASYGVLHGDIGAIEAAQDFISIAAGELISTLVGNVTTTNGGVTVNVPDGNIRAIEAGSIGIGNDTGGARLTTFTEDGIELRCPNGTVGLLSAFGNGQSNSLFVNINAVLNGIVAVPIKGDYQVVNCAGTFFGGLYTNAGIGTIRVADFNVATPSQIMVNMDQVGDDGIIDLIDVSGAFGTLGGGGPHISTGPGGNVRYIHVGGAVFGDATFGGGTGGITSVYDAGAVAQIVDDSGSTITITPVDNVASTTTPPTPVAALTLITYPIEGSGGSVIISAICSGSVNISTSGDVPGQTAEIGTLIVQGTGNAVIAGTTVTPVVPGGTKLPVVQPTTPTTPPVVTPPTTTPPVATTPAAGIPTLVTTGPQGSAGLQETTGGQPLFVNITGAGQVDVLSLIIAAVGSTTALSNATNISNTTGGEMVTIQANSIGQLISTGPIGISKRYSPAEVNPTALLPTVGNIFPFVQQHTGVVATGNILSVQAPELGNIVAVNGNIGQIVATAGGLGIVAPIYAYSAGTTAGQGDIDSVQIGGGVAYSGSGTVGLSGIYADGRIGTISGNNADIRGNIIATSGIDSIHLNNGSLININIAATGGSHNQSSWTEPGGFVAPTTRTVVSTTALGGFTSTVQHPVLEVVSISLTGNGGIIGTYIAADHIGTISVTGGFGIFTSLIQNEADGSIGTVRADGYGIRGTRIGGGFTVGSVILPNQGQQLPVSDYSASVRQSDVAGQTFDPYFNQAPSIATDLNKYLGTVFNVPLNPFLTTGGVFGDSSVVGSRTLTTLSAYRIQDDAGFGLLGPTVLVIGGVVANVPPGTLLPNQVDFGNSIGTIVTTSTIDSLGVITGKLKNFHPGSDVSNLDMEISGKISNVTIHGNLVNGSIINAKGINGNIGTIKVFGNLDGTITAHRKIASLTVAGNLTGLIDAPQVAKIIITGALQTGTLTINGNLGTLIDTGTFGSTGQTFVVHGSATAMKITGNLSTSTTIDGGLKLLQVGGSITAGTTVSVGGALKLLRVVGNIEAGATVTGHPIVKQKILGQVLGNVVAV